MTDIERIQYIKVKLDEIERKIESAEAEPQPRAKRGLAIKSFMTRLNSILV